VLWEAWDVYPGQHWTEEHDASRHLPSGMADGWLCFQSGSEKRRLMPVPEGWDGVADDQLWVYCRAAQAVRQRKRQPG
jgi:hypothetical protein